MKGAPPIWVWLSLAAALAMSLYSISRRVSVESKNKAVGIVAELDTVRALAAAEGITEDDALGILKVKGLGGLAISEQTLSEWVGTRRAEFDSQNRLTLTSDSDLVRAAMALGDTSFTRLSGRVLQVKIPQDVARSLSVGLDPADMALAKKHGLFVVGRFGNPVFARTARGLQWIKPAAQAGMGYFLPQGDQVLGRRGGSTQLLETLRENSVWYASPEFTRIAGDSNMLEGAPDRVVRLHAAQAAELDKLSIPGIIERYAKAAAERGHRLLLIRPAEAMADSPLDAFGGLIQLIAKQIEKEGLVLGRPHGTEDPDVPRWLPTALGICLLPLAFWVVSCLGVGRTWALALTFGLACLAVAAMRPIGMQLLALVCAAAFPLVGWLLATKLERMPVLALFLLSSFCSLMGGLCVAAILNGVSYFVKADVFQGVKIAHMVPILAIGLLAWMQGTDWRAGLRSPIAWSQLLLGAVVLGLMGFMASRLGNDSPTGVSGAELQLRSLLERFLPVRPRTKEFLVGHPVQWIALAAHRAAVSGREPWAAGRSWVALLFAVGTIGQASITNTMCHLHTPVIVGLTRVGVGLAAGGIIGAILWGMIGQLKVRRTQ